MDRQFDFAFLKSSSRRLNKRFAELGIHDLVKARDLRSKAVHRILGLLRSVAQEMVRLPRHGAQAADLPVHPREDAVGQT